MTQVNEDYNAYMKEFVRHRYIKLKLRAVEYKGGKCIDCGYNKLYVAMDFHHRNPSEKEFTWHKLRKRAWDSIKNELDKCDLLCRNCHAERHYNERAHREALRNRVDPRLLKPKSCEGCGANFKPIKSIIKFCSRSCKYGIVYPSAKELEKRMKNESMLAIAKSIGCSDNGLRKHLRKLGLLQ